MSKPLVLQVIPTLSGGGAEREVARVAPVLKADGRFDVAVCCVMSGGVFAESVSASGVDVDILNESPTSSSRMFFDLVRYLRKRRPAIVHSHLLRWGPMAARTAGIGPTIMSEHSWNPPRSGVGMLFDRFAGRFVTMSVAVSEATRQIRINKWRVPAKRIITIPNAVDIGDTAERVDHVQKRSELGFADGTPLIGTIGRLVPIKAQKYFIEAAAKVLKSAPESRFVLVGEGELRGELEQQVAALGIAEEVKFLGFREDAREIACVLDVACLSSDSEGTPITMLEAMSCGIPAVVTDVGGCPEVVQNGVTGFVVPPRDPDALAEAILKLIGDRNMARRFGIAGKDRANTVYSVEANLASLNDLYQSVLSN